MNRVVLLAMLYVFCISSLLGQSRPDKGFALQGKLTDSVSALPVVAATISAVSKKTNKIIRYGISNTRGEFSLPDIPHEDSLLIQVDHLSFIPVRLKKIIPHTTRFLDVGTLTLRPRTNELTEIKIDGPPILMNKDTLEIYPAAFSTQPNAVVEDLLKKVPGVVVWGDGQITVNGKKVTTVLVEGKPFFGGDPIIATRNLPKDAVGKIKIYEKEGQETWEEKPLTMDISLKNENKNGLFGKAGGGIGNQKRREVLTSTNYFDKKRQISVFGGYNNTNKEAYTVRDFLRVNTYKAGSEDLNAYTSSFNQIGFNTFGLAGSRIERIWTDQAKSDFDGLYYRKKADITQQTQEIVELGKTNRTILANRQENNQQDVLKLNTNHHIAGKQQEYNLTASLNQTRIRRDLHTGQSVEEDGSLLSNFDNQTAYTNSNNTQNVQFGYLFKDKRLIIDRWKFTYAYEKEHHQTENGQQLLYEGNEKTLSPIYRKKINTWQANRHELYGMGDLFSILQKYLNWRLQVSSLFIFTQQHETQDDNLFNTEINSYNIPNKYLIYKDHYKEFNWTPGIQLSRSYHTMLARGSNGWGFQSNLHYESIHQTNRSDHKDRKIENDFGSFLPSAHIYYRQNRSRGNHTFRMGYATLVKRPERHQQINLMDSVIQDFNYVGNPQLRSENQQQFEFRYNSSFFKNSSNHSLRLRYTFRKNMMGDSTVFHTDGSRTQYTTNFKGKPFYSADYNYMASMKVLGKPLNISLITGVNGGQNNYYVNNDLKETNDVNLRLLTNLTYVATDLLTVRFSTTLNKNYINYDSFKTNAFFAGFGNALIWNWPKRTSMINSFSVRSYSLTEAPTNRQYLWNMQVYHRFSKKELFEVKFALYDILRQKKNVMNTISNNRIRQEVSNNLQQYFMLSFSYFPRRF